MPSASGTASSAARRMTPLKALTQIRWADVHKANPTARLVAGVRGSRGGTNHSIYLAEARAVDRW